MTEKLNSQCAWCGAFRHACSWDKQNHQLSQATTHGICPACVKQQLQIPLETFKQLCQAEQLRTA